MKINFDTIEKDLTNSFESTLTSFFNPPSKKPNQSSNQDQLYYDISHSMVLDPAIHHKNAIKSSKFDIKSQNSSISSSNLFSSSEKRPKIPKKFSNLKTIQDMQSFIN